MKVPAHKNLVVLGGLLMIAAPDPGYDHFRHSNKETQT